MIFPTHRSVPIHGHMRLKQEPTPHTIIPHPNAIPPHSKTLNITNPLHPNYHTTTQPPHKSAQHQRTLRHKHATIQKPQPLQTNTLTQQPQTITPCRTPTRIPALNSHTSNNLQPVTSPYPTDTRHHPIHAPDAHLNNHQQSQPSHIQTKLTQSQAASTSGSRSSRSQTQAPQAAGRT